jgi:hypothetical protein
MLAALCLARVASYHRALTGKKYLHCAESYRSELLKELKLLEEERASANTGG